jgi:hypothetical protein
MQKLHLPSDRVTSMAKTPFWFYVIVGMSILGVIISLSVAVYAFTHNALWYFNPAPVSDPAYISVNPKTGTPNTLIEVVGYGWKPDTLVDVWLVNPDTGQSSQSASATAFVKEDGNFTIKVIFPEQFADYPSVTVLAASRKDNLQATTIFYINQRPTATPTPVTTSTITATPTQSVPTAVPATPIANPEIIASATPVSTATPVPPTATATQLPPTPTKTPQLPATTPTPAITAWRGEYYANSTLTGNPVLVRNDLMLNFDWANNVPAAGLPADGFSVRWTRTLKLPAGLYRFYVIADDGVRIWLNNTLLIDAWRDAMATTLVAEQTLSASDHTLRIEYYENRGDASIQFWWERSGDFPQWRGEYYTNQNLSGEPAITRNDPVLEFNWGYNPPANNILADRFSVRWTRTMAFDSGTYRFAVTVDDGAKLYIDGILLINTWQEGAARTLNASIPLNAGNHTLRLEYFEATGQAEIKLRWEQLTTYPDWKGEYWDNSKLEGSPIFTRNDVTLDFKWGDKSPDPRLPADKFSARWTRTVNFEDAIYRFHLSMDDGARLWVDNRLVIDEWRDGGVRENIVDVPLTADAHSLRVEYYENGVYAQVQLSWEKISTAAYPDWQGEYWSNPNLDGKPALVRNDAKIEFNWGEGRPHVSIPDNNFSIRWSRTLAFQEGIYLFSARADDGVRIYVDDIRVLNEWHSSEGKQTYKAEVPITGGDHRLVIEYYEASGSAKLTVGWERLGNLPTPTVTSTPTTTPTSTSTPSTAD